MYNILVVDDDKEIANAIEIYLSREGYNIIKAFDGEEAVRMAHDESINLIILDIMLISPNIVATKSNPNNPISPQLIAPIIISTSAILSITFILAS